jgi:energy-converting hydrogenase Eha subunit F
MYTLLGKLCNFIAYQKELDCILFLSLPLEELLAFQKDLLLKEDKVYPIPTRHFSFL